MLDPSTREVRTPPRTVTSLNRQQYSTPIPAPVSSLIGRGPEIEAALHLIRDPGVRLITLTGPGGVGKTRLALHLARMVQLEAAGDVAYVELAPVGEPAAVLPTIARALSIRLADDRPAQRRLEEALHNHTILLVLDNFEHLLNAAASLIELLRTCPALTIMVTSRSVLNLSGEHVLPVPPLAWRRLPEPGEPAPPGLAASSTSDAERLFIERATAIEPSFADHFAPPGVIAEICARLDGLPLAIELAAARSYLLSPEELLDRLDRRLPLLTGGARDLPARQQTMRDAIAWSYDLIDPVAQAVLRRLAVFTGSWSLDAAATVCWDREFDDSLRQAAILPAIESLARMSMVSRVSQKYPLGASYGPLFALLETVREFTEVELFRAGELEQTRERHAAYFAAAATRLEPIIWGDAPGDARLLIAAELGNYRTALDWALERGQTEPALQIVGAIFDPEATQDLSRLLGHTSGQLDLVERALALPGGSDDARASALNKASHLADAHGDSARALRLAEQALERSRQSGNPLRFAHAAYVRGRCAFRAGDLPTARHWLETASAGFEAAGAHGGAAWAQCLLASTESCDMPIGVDANHPALVRAAARCDAALVAFRRTGHKPGISRAMSGQAYIAYKQGNWPLALTLLHDLLLSAWEEGRVVLNCVEDIADIAARTDHPALAARLYGAIEADRRAFGQVVPPVFGGEVDAEMANVRRLLGEAGYAREFAAGQAMPIEQAVAEALSFAAGALAPAPVHLTSREQEILPLLIENLTAQEMADRLFLSRRTVETHLANLYAKLGVHSRSEALIAASSLGLLGNAPDSTSVSAEKSP